MLDDLTIGIILTCKHGYKGSEYKDAIKEFLSDYTLTPIKYYTESALRSILIHCFEDSRRRIHNAYRSSPYRTCRAHRAW